MKNYYYSKENKAIIPFDKVLFVSEDTTYNNVSFVSFSTNVYIKLKGREDEEFRKAYTEWLETTN
jgi:hypothetical protein